jgi:hypothetical protein
MKPGWRLRALLSAGLFTFITTIMPLAQDKATSSTSQSGTAGGSTITVTGCLTGSDGRYTLGTMSDKLYILRGDNTKLKKFNARRVRITGSVSEPPPHTSNRDVLSQQPPSLTVNTIEKVADTCS